MGVQAIKLKALLQEWTARFAECRSSGMTVRAWCEAQGLSIKTYYYWEKRVAARANQQAIVPTTPRSGMLIRVDPGKLPSGDSLSIRSDIAIRHGESIITLPAGSSTETVADLVKALNRHA